LSAALNPPSLAETLNAKGFSHAAGFRIVAVEPGRAEVALARREDLVQFFGHFHGGVITALADHAAGIAVTSGLPAGRIGVTVEIKVNFLSPAAGQELVARAKTLKMSGSIGVATVEVFSRDGASGLPKPSAHSLPPPCAPSICHPSTDERTRAAISPPIQSRHDCLNQIRRQRRGFLF
jgi:uncharacterized protein (TIGR00369 family)